jgi:ABC-2 type transport system permease protein
MHGPARYLRLFRAFARFSLAGELAFRGNFLLKVLVELLWLGILLVFYDTVFAYTDTVAHWSRDQYMVFLGCYYALEGVIETLFLENCTDFADLVRSGDLDLYLLKPIDEQFLVSCRKIDWSTAPKLLLGALVMSRGLTGMGWQFDLAQVLLFLVMFVCGVALAYSFLLILTSSSVWMMRNQSLMELWWLATTVMRYPREVYRDYFWAVILQKLFWYALPMLLVVNMPASVIVRQFFEPWHVAFTFAATAVMLAVSRWFFFRALRSYRSASS